MSNIPSRFSGLWPIRRTGSADNERAQVNKLFKEILISYDDTNEISWGSITGNIADQKDLSEFWQEIPHADLIEIQGGTDNEYYHLTETEHTRATDFLDGGTNTHTEVDTHIADMANPHSVTLEQARTENNTVEGPVVFTEQTAPAYTAGQLFYNQQEQSLVFRNDESDVGLNIGQENFVRVRNETGGTIINGQAVYINGSHPGTGLPTIALAQADARATCEAFIGVATHDIENNSLGYITELGVVRDLDTSSYSNGDPLYLSAATAGTLTTTAPSQPNFVVPVGVVTKANASTGRIAVLTSGVNEGLMTAGRIPFGGTDGYLKEDAGFSYDPDTNTLNVGIVHQDNTPHALTDVTTTSQTREVDVTNGLVQTIEATEDFTIDATGPSGQITDVLLYVYNSSGAPVDVLEGTAVVGTKEVVAGSTMIIPCIWDGDQLWIEREGTGDLRLT